MTSAEKRPQHVIGDLWDCPPQVLRDEQHVREAMLAAARESGATVVDQTFHRFDGGGISGVVAVKESHLTVHTWPERGYAAVDVFLCGQPDPYEALRLLAERLRAKRMSVRTFVRGDCPEAAGACDATALPRSRGGMAVLYGVTLVVAACSIIYELLLAQTLSALLGNTVLRYSITIGCYLGALGVGALLCSRTGGDAGRRLSRIEIELSVLGGLAVPALYALDMVQRFVYLHAPAGSLGESVAPALFLLASHAIIVAIGLLSGFEVPLLLALGEGLQPGATNRVLGVDYFGALVGSVLFPVVLLRSLGLIAGGFAVGLLNAVTAALLIVWTRGRPRLGLGLLSGAVVAWMICGLAGSGRIEQYFLKKLYYAEDATSPRALFALQGGRPDIERYRSPYQTIDLVRDTREEQWIYDLISTKQDAMPEYPADLWLYLDHRYQLFSGVAEVYHEWFVHAPVQASGRVPRDVLVLGGGDGLALREVLKYGAIRRVVQVEIDPVMLSLARAHPQLSLMNGGALGDARVEIVRADAFGWLQETADLFDAVYIDMPDPDDYDVSLVYSREFYAMVRHHLRPDGFVAVDTPNADCTVPEHLWNVYSSTLRAAGFETVVPMLTVIDADAPNIAPVADEVAWEAAVDVPAPGGRRIRLSEAQTRDYVRGTFAEELGANVQEFTLAFPAARSINVTWRDDLAVPTHLFGRWQLPAAFTVTCPAIYDAASVNSALRPVLPELHLVSMRFP
jgi:spermidine synthase